MVVGDIAVAVDVVVLGAGPAGYVAAIRAAQLGKSVVVVEPNRVGGICLNFGCIPAKSLLLAADQVYRLNHLHQMGISVSDISIDLAQMQRWKLEMVDQLVDGVSHLFEAHNIELVKGIGWFLSETEVRIEGEYGAKRFSFERCVIAVGTQPRPWPGLNFDGKRVLTATQALQLTVLPEDISIIGHGSSAAEVATFFAKLGVLVTVLIPQGKTFLDGYEPMVTKQVMKRLTQLGVHFETEVADPTSMTANAERVVVSYGHTPNTADLALDSAGVQTDERGYITVNNRMQTTNRQIFAAGDVTGSPALATVAMRQGKIAAEAIAGQVVAFAPQAVPRIVWTDPEVATVGLTVHDAQAAGYNIKTNRLSLLNNSPAITLGEANYGFVLVVADADTDALLGATLVGPSAAALVGEAALALEMGATLTDLAETLHPHPGLGEALQHSAQVVLGESLIS